MVTTPAGDPGPSVRFISTPAFSFHNESFVHSAALHVPQAKTTAAATAAARSHRGDRDVGCLYVGCTTGIHVFDLETGCRACFFPLANGATGLTLSQDGTRLWAVKGDDIHCIDTRSGTVHRIKEFAEPQTRINLTRCVLNHSDGGLIISECTGRRIVRLVGLH
jgi:hypothetical protein